MNKFYAATLRGTGAALRLRFPLFLLMLLATVVANAQQWVGSATTNDSIFRNGKVLIGRTLFTGNLVPLNARLEVVNGAIAQVQSGRYGQYTNTFGVPVSTVLNIVQDNKWAGLGQAGTFASPITGTVCVLQSL